MKTTQTYNETFRASSSRPKMRPLSSAKIQKRPQTSFNQNNVQNIQINSEEFKGDLDVLYLIMKSSPVKYDLNLVNEKFKKLNEVYAQKRKYQPIMSKTDELYYKYNILYGTKSNEIIRSYSPKMRPQSASFSNFRKDPLLSQNDVNCFSDEEIQKIFIKRCEDLNISPKENLHNKFSDYCSKKCINREADFTDCNMKLNTAVVLSQILKQNEKVSKLNLAKNCIGDSGVDLLMRGIKDSLSIVSLNLQSNDLTYRGGDIIFSALLDQHSIISINLSSLEGLNRNRLTADGVKKLEKVLKVNLYIEFLHLAGNNIKNEGLKYLLTGLNNNTTLHVLDISNNDINAQGMNYFNSILKKSKLFELNLSYNPIGNLGADTIADCVNNSNLHSLKRIDISNCKIDFQGAFNLFAGIQNNKKIESLNLSNNNLSSDRFVQLKPILSVLGLKELKLNKCKIGNLGGITIAESSCINSALKILDIGDNKIDDKGFQSFVNIPLSNFSLEKFDVSKNLITDASGREFCKNLSRNTALRTINFFDNQLKNECGTILIDSLRTNKNITKINLKYNRMQIRLIDEIQKLLKLNTDNIRQKTIPNLKKEIKQSYITDNDFVQCENKIQDRGVHVKNLVERLNEETVKYTQLKIEEEQKVKDVDNKNDNYNEEVKEMEEKIRKVTNNIKLLQTSHNVQTDNLNKDIASILESIKALEIVQRQFRAEQDNVRIQLEYEITNLNPDLKQSEEKLSLAILSSESMKRELENKRAHLERLEHPKLEQNLLANNPTTRSPMKRENKTSSLMTPNDLKLNPGNGNTLKKENRPIDTKKKNQDNSKPRPKSTNPMLRPKQDQTKKTPTISTKKTEIKKPNK